MTVVEFNCQLKGLESQLSNFAKKLTSNNQDAMDLLQDTMVKAFTYRSQFACNSNLKAWTFTIMKNTFINNYRRKIRQNTAFDDTKDLYFLSQNKDTIFGTPDSTYSVKELTRLIESLDNHFKTPLKMHIEGHKYTEIAKKLDLNLGTVKSRIFFARKKLMDSINHQAY